MHIYFGYKEGGIKETTVLYVGDYPAKECAKLASCFVTGSLIAVFGELIESKVDFVHVFRFCNWKRVKDWTPDLLKQVDPDVLAGLIAFWQAERDSAYVNFLTSLLN